MKKYLLNFAVMLMGAALFTACDDDDNTTKTYPVVVSNGAYVVCAGNSYSNINSSLTYIDYATKSAAQNQFRARNGRELGAMASDAMIYGSKMYVVVSAENTIEVLDAKTLTSIRQIKTTDLMGVEQGATPRCITAAGGMVFVSTYGSSSADFEAHTTSGNGYVAAIDTVSYSLQKIFTAGSYPEGITVSGSTLYVANSDYSMGSKASVSAIDMSTGTDTPITNSQITNPTTIATDGTNLYVLDMGNYGDVKAGVRRITGNNVTTLFDATVVGFSGYNIYSCNAPYGGAMPTEFSVYDIRTGSRSTISNGLNGKLFSPNAIGVDPVTGRIYIASYSEDPNYPGSVGYSLNGYVAEYSSDGVLQDTYTCGVDPRVILFNAGIEYVTVN